MRILFFMAHAGHARNFESTLRMLVERGHDVHVAVDRTEKKHLPDLGGLLEAISEENPSLTVGPAPARSRTDWTEVGKRFRESLDYIGYLYSDLDRPARLRDRAQRRTPALLGPIARLKPARSVLRRALELADAGTPIARANHRFVAEQRPDIVLITPLVELGSPQLDYLRAARALGVPTGLLVASWDNLTVKGLIHESPDLITVWNEKQRQEAIQLHHLPAERVVVTGAAAYDHWFDWKPGSARDDFCQRLGLDPGRPVILYVGSSRFIAPREAEFVVEWASDLLRERNRTMPDFQLLVRPHPSNPLTGAKRGQRALVNMKGLVVYPPNGANPTSRSARVDYFDSMYHSTAVVGVNTSALIESAIVGRPGFSLLAPRFRDTQKGSRHFQYLLPANGGMLNIATSPQAHAEQLAAALRGEDAVSRRRNHEFLSSFIRPFGIGDAATPHQVEAIEALAGQTPLRPPGRRR